ncbi:MAG TPA: aminotransferase class III-fold pyridoxal phosphate-dependent enzyme [Acidimicrobiia bacterium]|nr:aminotransferase class III-fold pyridoxal phosphate-dependent enzyme [Acidimicrobiia bacterium]
MSSLWHAFAEMNTVQDAPFVVTRGEGCYVWDRAGNRYLDGTAGLWFANLGYGRREIAEAVARQMGEIFAYHNFTDYVTEPTLALADRIASHCPNPGSKVFFTSGGSDAVDSAAKLVRRYHQLTGAPERTVFIAREWAYHGMHTYGTSLAGIEPNRSGYGDLVSDIVLVPFDDTEAIEKAIDHAGPERIAGIYCEPVIGAGGVRPVPVDYLHKARDLVRAAGGLFISDEVITGFGRIGDWFAANRFDLDPDLILFAKGVTAGYLPLGGLIASHRVSEPFFTQPGVMWRHGYTYSGHATVCAAALEVLRIYEEEPIFSRALELENELQKGLSSLVGQGPAVGLRAGTGAMAALQLDPSDATLSGRVAVATRRKGVIVRSVVGNGLQISPPLIMTPSQVDELVTGLETGLRSV